MNRCKQKLFYADKEKNGFNVRFFMPELPEVETVRRDLVPVLVGKKITKITVLHAAPVKDGVKKFIKSLQFKTIHHIDRIGKLLIVDVGEGVFLLIHLKMTGQLIYRKGATTVEGGHSLSGFKDVPMPSTFTWVVWHLNDGSDLYFNDMRKFGYLKIVDAQEKDRIVARYGAEPLTKKFTLDYFLKILEKRNTPIKSLLLNQTLVAGIGNIYADEICFDAGIFPGIRVAILTMKQKKKLFQSIGSILKKAIKYKGTTFKNYLSPHGKKGNFLDFLQVYQREGKKCLRCDGGIIAQKRIGGRNSRYCPLCQKVLH